jgi:hypothetical protein
MYTSNSLCVILPQSDQNSADQAFSYSAVFKQLIAHMQKMLRPMQGVSGGIVNILGGSSMDYSE